MSTIATGRPTIQRPGPEYLVDDAHLAAVAFLARYSGRTLEAYRHDLRDFFQRAADNAVAVLEATRPHIEVYRSWMEDRGLAASTIDRRLSTVCGFYRFAHHDGRIGSNPAQYVRRPHVHPTDARGLDRPSSACSCSPPSSTTATTRRSPCSLGSTVCGSARPAPPTSRTLASIGATERCASSARATSPPSSRSPPHSTDNRPRRRRTLRRADPAPTRPPTPRPAHRPPLDPRHRQTSRARRSPSAHAPRRLHHGRPRCRRAPARRPDRSPSRRPAHHHHLRPTSSELRSPRRLRRRRLRRRRLTQSNQPQAALRGACRAATGARFSGALRRAQR
jgi:hypothetical protein